MRKKLLFSVTIGILAMFLLMTQGEITAKGVTDGIDFCIRVIIPSLFPFFFITSWLNARLMYIQLPGLRQLVKLTKAPCGTEGILLLGLIGGYPVGAQCIYNTYKDGKITASQAKRMLAFCNNAGPSFIFGITYAIFSSVCIPWVIWLIQIISAILVGVILPEVSDKTICKTDISLPSISHAMKQAIQITASVCGWIILFKAFLEIISKLHLSPLLSAVIWGLLELSNGCQALTGIKTEVIRFILISAFLSFGGLCVWLQTQSATGELKNGLYLHGKIMQTCISSTLAILIGIPIFHVPVWKYPLAFLVIGISFFVLLLTRSLCIKKLWKSQLR